MIKCKRSKKVDIKLFVDFANRQLKRTDSYADIGFKMGIYNFIEKVLIETGNYSGTVKAQKKYTKAKSFKK